MITTSYFVTYTISCALKIFSTGLNPWVHYIPHGFLSPAYLDLYKLVDDLYPKDSEGRRNFFDKRNLSKILIESMSGDVKYSSDLMRGVLVNDKGEFNLPPMESLNTTQIQSLCFSLLRNRVAKQKSKGGAAIQATCFGNDNLHIVMSKDKKSIEYLECFMPFFAREKFKDFIDPNTGILDIDKIDPELLKIVGYRIPTEDKYSAFPLKIIGFMPYENGSTIILPKEVTAIQGSDFDVDKMFLIVPEFRMIRNTYDRVLERFVFNKQEFKDEQYRRALNKLNDLFDNVDTLNKGIK